MAERESGLQTVEEDDEELNPVAFSQLANQPVDVLLSHMRDLPEHALL
jgi:riboflavin biosynthesis pyrimidine reductase